ncbi:hypothetical protein PIB30_034820 [Stylosanthes scabra]|uniref:Uncharacterized protein n=1 Tax=Stylosanthes scabra TaxID=79078 RepID=A0ABU6VBY9_9FABA|nr:hypothetical protein [Stylosanthes scabra]
MDDPPTLLIALEWERMPWIAPIPRYELGPPHVSLANKWNRWPRRHNYRVNPEQDFKKEIDDIINRVMRRFRQNQTRPGHPEDLGKITV